MSYKPVDIKKIFGQKGPIVSFSCTNRFVYIATKKQIFCRSIEKANDKDVSAELPSGSQSVLHIYNMTIDNDIPLILLQTDNNFFVKNENSFPGKWIPVNLKFPYSSKYVHFAPLKRDSLGAFIDSQNIHIYSFAIDQFSKTISTNWVRTVQHGLSNPIDILAAEDTMLIHAKKEYKIFNSKLEELTYQKIPRPFHIVVPIIGHNCFCAIQDNNTLIQLNDDRKIFSEEIRFPEAVYSLQIKLPYVCAILQKSFMYFLTVSSVENNIFPLPKDIKTKYPAMLYIRNNYNLFYASDDSFWSFKYDERHDKEYLITNGKWDQLIEMNDHMGRRDVTFYHSIYEEMFYHQEYKRAFECFKKSDEHPFELLGKFGLLKAENIQKEAKQDANDRVNLLEKLHELVTAHDQDQEKISEALEEVRKQSHLKENSRGEKELNQSVIQDEINETKNVLKDIYKLYQPNSKKKDIDDQNSNKESLYSELLTFILELVKKEYHPTVLKVYNTILILIYSKKGMILKIEPMIEVEKSPVFFSIVSEHLSKLSPTVMMSLCEQYQQHEIAIEAAKKANEYNQLISYISSSSAYLKLAPQYLKEVFEYYCEPKDKNKKEPYMLPPSAAAKKAAGLFFSKRISPDSKDIMEVLNVIDSIELKQDPKDTSNYNEDVKEAFLSFAVFTLHSKSISVHLQLADLYIKKLLKMYKSYGKSYQSIASSKSEVKQIRESLIKLLSESDYYEPQEIIQKLPDDFLEEKIMAYLKINSEGSLNNCIELVINPNVQIEIAVTKFCDIAYDKDDPNRSNVYNLLFQALKMEYSNCQNDDDRKKDYLAKIKFLLNERAEFLNSTVVENIPENIPIHDLEKFMDNSTRSRINRLRLLKVQNALLEETLKEKKSQIQYLKAGKIVVTKGLKCIVCGKSIDESIFYVRNDSTVAHLGCNASHTD